MVRFRLGPSPVTTAANPFFSTFSDTTRRFSPQVCTPLGVALLSLCFTSVIILIACVSCSLRSCPLVHKNIQRVINTLSLAFCHTASPEEVCVFFSLFLSKSLHGYAISRLQVLFDMCFMYLFCFIACKLLICVSLVIPPLD